MAGLYIHVPFCVKRCIYCDFYSNTDMSYKDDYLLALLKEMEFRRDYLKGEEIKSVYFGGGTPSRLNVHDFERLFNCMYNSFPFSSHPEVTMEANPDDLSDEYIASLRTLPFNRISIGIQSFNDRELAFLNRRHTAAEAIRSVYRCKEAGFDNISIDLMYGLPGQLAGDWFYNMEKAVELDVAHLSAYHLTYEEGTPIYRMSREGKIAPVDDDTGELFFRMLKDRLEKEGFIHYEISNFAGSTPFYPDGRISFHNASYWNGAHYMGIGPSAHSYDGNTRSWNVSSVARYIKALNEESELPAEYEQLDERTKYNDFVITRLRTRWGISLEELEKMFGEEKKRWFLAKLKPFLCSEKLKVEGGFVKVQPDGLFVSDAIIRELIAV
jgi:oxygen-independent coproporphyrinogen-3 oxidase